MYKKSKNLEYPLNFLEDTVNICKDESVEEYLLKFSIECNETFYRWLDKYLEETYSEEVRKLVDMRYKEKKSYRQIANETGYSISVIQNRIGRIGKRFWEVSHKYRKDLGIPKRK